MRDALARALAVDILYMSLDQSLPLIVRGLHTISPPPPNLGDFFDPLLHLAGSIRFERTIVPLIGNPNDHQTS
jgi:hypothetical protein